jgi:hypothetical protein
MHYFSRLGVTGIDSTKSAGTRDAELVFLRPMGSEGHTVHSDLFRA